MQRFAFRLIGVERGKCPVVVDKPQATATVEHEFFGVGKASSVETHQCGGGVEGEHVVASLLAGDGDAVGGRDGDDLPVGQGVVDDPVPVGVGQDGAPGGAVEAVGPPLVDDDPVGQGGVVVAADRADGGGDLVDALDGGGAGLGDDQGGGGGGQGSQGEGPQGRGAVDEDDVVVVGGAVQGGAQGEFAAGSGVGLAGGQGPLRGDDVDAVPGGALSTL